MLQVTFVSSFCKNFRNYFRLLLHEILWTYHCILEKEDAAFHSQTKSYFASQSLFSFISSYHVNISTIFPKYCNQ